MAFDTLLSVQVILLASAVVAVLALLVTGQAGAEGGRGRAWGVAAVVVGLCLPIALARNLRSYDRAANAALLTAQVPDRDRADAGYVSSDTCLACHPDEHRSWHQSFHRTMTQVAGPDSIIGDFDDVHLEVRGRRYHLTRQGDRFLVDSVDPDWEHASIMQRINPDAVASAPSVDRPRPVVMTTGMHHMQGYWLPSAADGKLFRFPFIYLRDEQRWIPTEAAFLRPPDAERMYDIWNNTCIDCHAVAGEPGVDPQQANVQTRVAELGISCEACHGPAADHVAFHRDPANRYRSRLLGDGDDPTIVHPEKLTPVQSSHLCGQCHGIALKRNAARQRGESFLPGDDLSATRSVVRGTDRYIAGNQRDDWGRQQRWLAQNQPDFMRNRYWSDGMVRVSGREFNGMIESACYQAGELSCLSCHSMHSPIDADDQLAPGMHGDQACLQCHQNLAGRIEAHTHHPPASSGSRCYNCHMPYTTYGLMKGIRSHLIDSPTVAAELATGRPNACNLCHLDRSLAWTADHLQSWYGTPSPPALDEQQQSVAASVLWMLRGDAGTRALAAYSLGWTEARQASGSQWMPAYLAMLLDDPYATVRFIAFRALRSMPGYQDIDYDFVGDAAARPAARDKILERWQRSVQPVGDRSALLIDGDGRLDIEAVQRLLDQRDTRPLDLKE